MSLKIRFPGSWNQTLTNESPIIPLSSKDFCEILALNYAPEAAALGAWIIWSNILSQICSLDAPGAYNKYAIQKNAQCSRSMSKYAPRAVCIQIMLLEHIELRILPQIIHAPGAAAPGAAVPGAAAAGA